MAALLPAPGTQPGKAKRTKPKPVKIHRTIPVEDESIDEEGAEMAEAPMTRAVEAPAQSITRSVTKNAGASEITMSRPVAAGYMLPDPDELLSDPSGPLERMTDDALKGQSDVLTRALLSFGIEGKVTEIHPGPVVTMYEFEPAPGVKVARIVNLSDDLALASKATSLRIV